MASYDMIIIGAGAAGLMCALTAGARGKSVLLLDHAKKPGAKILISGGGRCNFTNEDASAANYISMNPHFAKSALKRYQHWDFLELLTRHDVSWHEKKLGQLFCDQGAGKILSVLLDECTAAGVCLMPGVSVSSVKYERDIYYVSTTNGQYQAPALVIATGGLSIPKMGSSDFAYRLAKQFCVPVIPPKAALVPLVFDADDLAFMTPLAGVAVDAMVAAKTGPAFRENILFTHRGLSGPAILQISSYREQGQSIFIDSLPDVVDAGHWLRQARQDYGKVKVGPFLKEKLPNRYVDAVLYMPGYPDTDKNLADLSNQDIARLTDRLKRWQVTPVGDEGMKKAEVTRGGIDTRALSSKTMEVKYQPGLYFIGECVDVTGWLGGYNFQWAWSSGWAAAQAV